MGKEKRINIQHRAPGRIPYALLPIGTYCNRGIQEAEPGAELEFWWNGWQHEGRVLARKCRIGIRSSVFSFMVRSIYGDNVRVEDLLKQWEMWSIREGIGRNGFDREWAMLVEVMNDERSGINYQ